MKFLIISLLFLLPTTAMAQSSAVKQIMKMAKEDNRTMQHLDILCNRFGGRLAGSPACETAEKWAKKCFEEWGYEVSLEKIGDMNVGFTRGGWWGRMTGEENMVLHFATPSFTSGTKGPQSGHVVLDPLSQIEFDRNKHTYKGAWVLVENLSLKGDAINYNEFGIAHIDEEKCVNCGHCIHNCPFGVSSELNKGSTFWFEFKIAE